jgi:hypothetical protein
VFDKNKRATQKQNLNVFEFKLQRHLAEMQQRPAFRLPSSLSDLKEIGCKSTQSVHISLLS